MNIILIKIGAIDIKENNNYYFFNKLIQIIKTFSEDFVMTYLFLHLLGYLLLKLRILIMVQYTLLCSNSRYHLELESQN